MDLQKTHLDNCPRYGIAELLASQPQQKEYETSRRLRRSDPQKLLQKTNVRNPRSQKVLNMHTKKTPGTQLSSESAQLPG
jgi:hypothetical protein